MHLEFAAASASHSLFLNAKGNRLTGSHIGRIAKGGLRGTIDGDKVVFSSTLPYESARLKYTFRGKISDGGIAGDVDLGEYGQASFTAKRVMKPETDL